MRFLALIALVCLITGLSAPRAAPFRIQPGPAEMSAEERAIEADPEAGSQHAVILLIEGEQDDPVSGYMKVSFHLRAKVLSNAARALGDIEIPMESKTWYLRQFWARTIHQDGRVQGLEKGDLIEQTVIRDRGVEARVLKAVMPGLQPGCLVDYGWVFQVPGSSFYQRIPLQRPWPVRRFRYRWIPSSPDSAQYYVRRRPGLEIEVTREKRRIVIEAENLPPVEDEPYGPPEDVITAGVTLYYGWGSPETEESRDLFWDEIALDESERVREFLSKDRVLLETMESMAIPSDAPLEEKLRVAYEWIQDNVRIWWDLTDEERERRRPEERRRRLRRNSLEAVLRDREGQERQIQDLFVGFARALGAEAEVILAPPRIMRYWDRGLLSRWQLSGRVIAVRAPGTPVELATMVDPASGLPYGMIPWTLAPTRALRVTREGAEEIVLRTSDPRLNLLRTKASIRYAAIGEPGEVKWSEEGTGYRRQVTRRYLHRSALREREESLRDQCGESAGFEVTSADVPGIDDRHGPYRLECEGRLLENDVDEGTVSHSTEFGGAWIPSLPHLISETREHPVVFDYPRIDLSSVDVATPAGFVPGAVPKPVKLQSPWVSYALEIKATSEGFRIQRAFAIVKVTVKPEEYGVLRHLLQQAESADRTMVSFERIGE